MSKRIEDSLAIATDAVNDFMEHGIADKIVAQAIAEIEKSNARKLQHCASVDPLGGTMYFLATKKSPGDAYEHALASLASDERIQEGLRDVADRWRNAAIQRMGTVAYMDACGVSREDMIRLGKTECLRQLADLPHDLANTFVRDNARQTLLDRLAQENAPKSGVEYFLHKSFENSLLGLPSEILSYSPANDAIAERAERIYGPSTAEKVGAHAGATMLDMMILPIGAGPSVASKGAIAAVSSTSKMLVLEGAVRGGSELMKSAQADKHFQSKREWQKAFAEHYFGNAYALDAHYKMPPPTSPNPNDEIPALLALSSNNFENISTQTETPTKGIRL